MNIFEKVYALLAILFAAGLIICLVYFPQIRLPRYLIPISLLGFLINVGLMFIVLRDIFSRPFGDQGKKYIWVALVLFFWPSILFSLPKYGFRQRIGEQLPGDLP